MNLLISQFFGIGDCIFSMQLARNWIAEGHVITWPVLPRFVDQLKRAYPFVEWMDSDKFPAPYKWMEEHDWTYRGKTYRYIPLRWANEMLKHPYERCMSDKFELFGLDFKDWRKGAMWARDEVKETELASILAIDLNTPFTIKNTYFGSNSQFKVQINVPGFEMKSLPGFSLFDYAAILENAEYIHVANSSILYLLECLELKAKEVHLYCRKPIENDFKNTDYIFTKKYNLHL